MTARKLIFEDCNFGTKCNYWYYSDGSCFGARTTIDGVEYLCVYISGILDVYQYKPHFRDETDKNLSVVKKWAINTIKNLPDSWKNLHNDYYGINDNNTEIINF